MTVSLKVPCYKRSPTSRRGMMVVWMIPWKAPRNCVDMLPGKCLR